MDGKSQEVFIATICWELDAIIKSCQHTIELCDCTDESVAPIDCEIERLVMKTAQDTLAAVAKGDSAGVFVGVQNIQEHLKNYETTI